MYLVDPQPASSLASREGTSQDPRTASRFRGNPLRRFLGMLMLAMTLFVGSGCNEAISPSAMDEAEPAMDQSSMYDVAGKGYGAQGIAGQWIVTFSDDVIRPRDLSRTIEENLGIKVRFTYERAMKGMSFNGTAEVAELVRQVPGVASVVEDMYAYAAGTITQTRAIWNIDRIDQAALPLSATYAYDKSGIGVRVYVIDSGIDIAHTQFGGRAFKAMDFVNDGKADCTGHGTHVAGTIGSTLYGVAKMVNLYSVRILPCTGGASVSTVIAALDFVTNEKLANPSIPMVANMSLAASYFAPLNAAVAKAVQTGVVVTAAAGNNTGADACGLSPASAPDAITVAATDKYDARLAASNVGPCVDLFAPGASVLSTYPAGKTATYSGTSQAAPHVAGVAALLLQVYPNATPAEIGQMILEGATLNKVANAGTGSPNRLLNSRIGIPAPNVAPTAGFIHADPNLTVVFTDKSVDLDGTIASRLWTFSDGTTSTATNPSKTFSAPGTYTVTLTVKDNNGASSTVSKQVTVFTTYVSKIILKLTLSSGKYYVTASVYTKYPNKATGTFKLNVTALNTLTATASSSGIATLKSTAVAASTGSVFSLALGGGVVGGISSCQIPVGTTTVTCVP